MRFVMASIMIAMGRLTRANCPKLAILAQLALKTLAYARAAKRPVLAVPMEAVQAQLLPLLRYAAMGLIMTATALSTMDATAILGNEGRARLCSGPALPESKRASKLENGIRFARVQLDRALKRVILSIMIATGRLTKDANVCPQPLKPAALMWVHARKDHYHARQMAPGTRPVLAR